MNKEKQIEEQVEGKSKRKGPSVSTIVLVVILVVGMVILLYPSVSDWWNSMQKKKRPYLRVQGVIMNLFPMV